MCPSCPFRESVRGNKTPAEVAAELEGDHLGWWEPGFCHDTYETLCAGHPENQNPTPKPNAMKMNIHTVCMKFKDEDGSDLFHSFDDFIESGSPMDEESEDELEDISEFAWFNNQPLPLETTQVFAKFRDSEGEFEFTSLSDLHISGVPVDELTDNEMDLESEEVFFVNAEGDYVELGKNPDLEKLTKQLAGK